jgi:hypothetical protein
MFVVRYVALAALVVWLAGMLPQAISDALQSPYLSLACGAVVLISLVVLKFVGPPPRAFFVRAGVVVAMLTVAGLASTGRLPGTIAAPVNITFAAVLLLWYVYE